MLKEERKNTLYLAAVYASASLVFVIFSVLFLGQKVGCCGVRCPILLPLLLHLQNGRHELAKGLLPEEQKGIAFLANCAWCGKESLPYVLCSS